MSTTAPLYDPRTAASLADDLTKKLAGNIPALAGTSDQASAALISIVARFGELVIERLNQAPDKNLLAFLDMIGASPLPPEPARVPLTFTTVTGSTIDGIVPAGTQVAAPPGENETDPVVFETERELIAIAANLQTLVAVDGERDLIADHSALLTTPAPKGLRAFAGDGPNEHILYIGHSASLANAKLDELRLHFHVSPDSPAATDARVLEWEIWDGANGIPLPVTRQHHFPGGRRLSDSTQNLAQTGEVVFGNTAQVPEQTVNGVRSRWLRCRLLTPIAAGTTPAQGMVRAAQLPLLDSVRVSTVIRHASIAPDSAFANTQPVDVTRAFPPFGDKPKIGDAFYIGHRDALGHPGSDITIDLTLVNPVPDTGGTPGVPSSDLQLKWEAWNGSTWALLGLTGPTGATGTGSLVDNGKAFTKSNSVKFTLPSSLAPTTVNGVESNWIRVQIVSGNYGVDTHYEPDTAKPGVFTLKLSTLAAPLVSAFALSSDVTTPTVAPDAVVAFNNGEFQDLNVLVTRTGSAAPFAGLPLQPSALYAGFALPRERPSFPNQTVSLYHGVRLPPYAEIATPLAPEFSVQTATAGTTAVHRFTLTNTSAAPLECDLTTFGGAWVTAVAPINVTVPPGVSTEVEVSVTVPVSNKLPGANASDRGFLTLRTSADSATHSVTFETRVGVVAPRRRELRFEYWNGNNWGKLVATDGTNLLTRPGVVEFLAPADFAPSTRFGMNGYWIRTLFEPGDDQPVQFRTLLPNTVFATQALTLSNEVLGSSDASANQQFKTIRSPVLAGPELQVRESGLPSAEELAALTAAGGSVITPTIGGSSEVWVRWIEVPDFYASTALDRHYVLDHLTGAVRFGDGVNGRIPPRGVGNIRMARYQTGGGDNGNRAAGTIIQLKTTVPFIDKVINVEAAEGGFAAETTETLLTRAPRVLRHGGRAVALEDYQDLARSASPEVARAKTVSLRNLRDDPIGNTPVAGAVSVVVVPLSTADKPQPSSGLIAHVEDYLRTFITPTATLAVVGPLYVRVDVTIEVALASLEGSSEVEDGVREALRQFLHPLTGGRDGAGWDFGREPQLSDLYPVVSDVPNVDHIRRLSIDQVEDLPGALATGRFMVYSGQHQITLTFLGAE